ncbi:hypothetical protein Nwi_0256 [Nitrobacter winogradskyi Nb-255]|uniref:Uncharacterized protein n=1 Tax=Nitrobacter winogradskyi (strain ATCC 25391 / DSM 10237 / CIP 104748 / NCIMB 11846 / Nb-255) TaxID=323098 RepID=Q3SW18_NITWN|nr:hypothetical protein [Nitrobacter winogradskyi]ABA03523.1 hypothetical protein Nwi_0256 [Nitrobacter winogradskyi Nb-255]
MAVTRRLVRRSFSEGGRRGAVHESPVLRRLGGAGRVKVPHLILLLPFPMYEGAETMKEERNRKSRHEPRGKFVTGEDYKKTWGTPLGQDCIDLHETLARWLGERLVFLADHTTTVTPDAAEPWHEALRRNGEALLRYAAEWPEGEGEAKRSLEWVARNLESLWD